MKARKKLLEILAEWLDSYLPKVKGVSPKTQESYRDCFRLLFVFLYEKKKLQADQVSFKTLNYKMLSSFLEWIESDRKCSISTRNQRLAALSSFSMYAQNRSFDAASEFRAAILRIPQKKGSKSTRSFFTTDEVKILLGLPNISTNIGYRDSILLSLMYATGARAQEICNLKVNDVSFIESGARISLLGKGGKRRIVIIGKTPSQMLQIYLQKRRKYCDQNTYVFSSQTHEMLSVSCIEEIFSKYVDIAKNLNPNKFNAKSYPPHSMRHTTACHMLEAGISLIAIKNFLGHSSVRTTEVYAEMTQDTIDKALLSWNKKWFSSNEGKETLSNNKPNLPLFLQR